MTIQLSRSKDRSWAQPVSNVGIPELAREHPLARPSSQCAGTWPRRLKSRRTRSPSHGTIRRRRRVRLGVRVTGQRAGHSHDDSPRFCAASAAAAARLQTWPLSSARSCRRWPRAGWARPGRGRPGPPDLVRLRRWLSGRAAGAAHCAVSLQCRTCVCHSGRLPFRPMTRACGT